MYLIAKEVDGIAVYKIVSNQDAMDYEYYFNHVRSKPDSIIELPSKLEKLINGNFIKIGVKK